MGPDGPRKRERRFLVDASTTGREPLIRTRGPVDGERLRRSEVETMSCDRERARDGRVGGDGDDRERVPDGVGEAGLGLIERLPLTANLAVDGHRIRTTGSSPGVLALEHRRGVRPRHREDVVPVEVSRSVRAHAKRNGATRPP